MTSDDIYFSKRQVDKLFEKLLEKKGKLRVVLPEIDSEKVKNEAKELEKKSVIKETAPEVEKVEVKPEIKVEKPAPEPEKVVETVEETAPEVEKAEVKPEIKVEKPAPEPEKVVEIVEEETLEVEQQEILSEEEEAVIEKVDKLLKEELLEEKVEEIETSYEVEEEIQENLFENILAEKTLEITEDIEETIEEEQPVEETASKKKKFSFKNIITETLKGSNGDEAAPRQKAGFKTSKVEEPETQQIKLLNVDSSEDEEEDEEIAKILEEKIKKSLPLSEDKVISVEDDVIYPEFMEDNEEEQQDFDTLGELIELKKPESKLDYLLLTAYYLQTKEDLFKYSLKQLNSKSMPFLGSLIDHSVIHNAVAHDFIEVVPDYNGTADVTEYRLTPVGENYILS